MMVVILANDAHPNNMRQNMYMRTNSTPYYIPFCILECPLLIKWMVTGMSVETLSREPNCVSRSEWKHCAAGSERASGKRWTELCAGELIMEINSFALFNTIFMKMCYIFTYITSQHPQILTLTLLHVGEKALLKRARENISLMWYIIILKFPFPFLPRRNKYHGCMIYDASPYMILQAK